VGRKPPRRCCRSARVAEPAFHSHRRRDQRRRSGGDPGRHALADPDGARRQRRGGGDPSPLRALPHVGAGGAGQQRRRCLCRGSAAEGGRLRRARRGAGVAAHRGRQGGGAGLGRRVDAAEGSLWRRGTHGGRTFRRRALSSAGRGGGAAGEGLGAHARPRRRHRPAERSIRRHRSARGRRRLPRGTHGHLPSAQDRPRPAARPRALRRSRGGRHRPRRDQDQPVRERPRALGGEVPVAQGRGPQTLAR